MAEFIRSVVNGPVHLIAESAGGAAGCWLAIQDSKLVASLVLVAPAAFAGASHAPQPSSPEAMELRLFGRDPAWSEPPTDADRAARQRNASANVARLRPADGNADLLERYRILIYGAAHSLPVAALSPNCLTTCRDGRTRVGGVFHYDVDLDGIVGGHVGEGRPRRPSGRWCEWEPHQIVILKVSCMEGDLWLCGSDVRFGWC
jgi:pimeloyl-ACP methyl ester carboxylesterase